MGTTCECVADADCCGARDFGTVVFEDPGPAGYSKRPEAWSRCADASSAVARVAFESAEAGLEK